MRLHPNKHILSWKYSNSKLNWMHLIYETSQLSLTYFKHAQNIYIGGANHVLKSLIYKKKCWISHVVNWIPCWKLKQTNKQKNQNRTELLAGSQILVRISVV